MGAKVTKIGLKDFTLKDYMLAGLKLRTGSSLSGLIKPNQHLPNEMIPSDHSLILTEVWNIEAEESMDVGDSGSDASNDDDWHGRGERPLAAERSC